MLGTIRRPNPLHPNRALAMIYLGTALALLGAGTANAATSGPVASQPAAVVHHVTAHRASAHHQRLDALALPVKPGRKRGPASAAHQPAASHRAAQPPLGSWRAVIHAAAGPRRGSLPARERLLPAELSGPQAFMTMTSAREANAATIVRQALDKHMGLRSAVIAVATAMQESSLININYGTYDSLGLFQQRPSAGWGTAAQITDPTYASDAFLHALRTYQANHPGWATQPLWEAAQGVQNSGFPYAYAKWEDQAAHVVATVTRHLY